MLRDTWLLWLFFVCFGFISALDPQNYRISWRAEIIANVAFPLLVALWVATDAHRREQPLGYGFPALVFFLWPIFGPVYLFQTRGVRAFLTLLAFAAMFFIAVVIGVGLGMVT